jgi:hypothetical protein
MNVHQITTAPVYLGVGAPSGDRCNPSITKQKGIPMMTHNVESAQHWRELAGYLTPETIASFEASEHLARTEAHLAFPDQDPAEVLRRIQARLLEGARQQVPFAGVQLPAGATGADTWQDDGTGTWSRVVYGTRRDVSHLAIGIDGIQSPDGTVRWSAYADTDDEAASPEELRAYAAALTAAADELERLTAR